ncbi:carbonic anhydrase [Brevibacillus dissolubilis]|uniref:carbonic anhydrase n=1 Tax=Brevibacillus dissolubilis TaxID=1844116 RepID=UPI00210040DD|nr:carbonic anhydrase family protein [Brevibacillus dissolubilis]
MGKTQKPFLLATSLSLILTACGGTATEPPLEQTTEPPAQQPADQASGHVHWSYEGEGAPEHWGDISPDYATCVNGKEQSPINIETAKVKPTGTGGGQAFTLSYKPTPFTVINNGHTIQANPEDPHNIITIDSESYQLAQFHFHTPSEHQLNSQNFALELHLVHKNAQGHLAVLGVMLKEGAENPTIAKIWSGMPKTEDTEDVELVEPIDLNTLLPEDRKSFRYNGSLTTPPCSEGVKWTVLEQPIEMSREQIAAYQAIFPMNARPVQPVKERVVSY